MNNVTISRFFKVTSNLIEHTKQIKKLKGENFNLFQILRVETAENNTHSNFIAELLNPNGSHDLGILPLKHFLKILNLEHNFDLNKVRIHTEYHIGKIDIISATGGRIDILIEFPDGKTICIENKIYAGDQPQQIQRYYNFNTNYNSVYYLTLNGNDPSQGSKGNLKCDTHYFILSYQKHILEWLHLSLKEASNHPILRESIKQYIILIQKLTNTLDTNDQTKLKGLIFDYLEEAEYISNNYARAIYETKDAFRNSFIQKLKQKLDPDLFQVSVDCDVANKYSQVWVDLTGIKDPQLRFGIEPFSGIGHHNGNMFVGLFDRKGSASNFHLEETEPFSEVWITANYLKDSHNNLIKVSDHSFLKKVHELDSKVFENTITPLIEQSIDFIFKYQEEVENHLRLSALNPSQPQN